MQQFSYTAFNTDGRQRKGVVEALDLAEARRKLQAGGLSIAKIDVAGSGDTRVSLLPAPGLDIARFFRDLEVLMNAGLGLDQALRAMADASGKKAQQDAIGDILEKLAAGSTASAALGSLRNIPEDAVALIASGERSARLPYVLKALATDLERRALQRKQLVDAAVYPLFLMLMMVVAVGIVTFILVPTLEPIFESSGRDAPFIVGVLASLRLLLMEPGVMLPAISVILILTVLGLLRPAIFARISMRVLLKLPMLGRAMSQSALARYLQSLGMLIENAVPLPEALALSARCCPAISFRERLASMKDVVVSGKRLPEAFTATGLFPRGVISLVAIGDEVNRLPAVLDNASTILRAEAQRTTDRLLALMTPAITIFLGLLVGGLVISVMTALLGINDLSVQ